MLSPYTNITTNKMVPEDARMLAFTSSSGQNNKDRNYHKRGKNQQKQKTLEMEGGDIY